MKAIGYIVSFSDCNTVQASAEPRLDTTGWRRSSEENNPLGLQSDGSSDSRIARISEESKSNSSDFYC